jgi:hypothetical protein
MRLTGFAPAISEVIRLHVSRRIYCIGGYFKVTTSDAISPTLKLKQVILEPSADSRSSVVVSTARVSNIRAMPSTLLSIPLDSYRSPTIHCRLFSAQDGIIVRTW